MAYRRFKATNKILSEEDQISALLLPIHSVWEKTESKEKQRRIKSSYICKMFDVISFNPETSVSRCTVYRH